MVIHENDPRQLGPCMILGVDDVYVYTRAGSDGSGRRSRILRRRLAEGHYHIVSWPQPEPDHEPVLAELV